MKLMLASASPARRATLISAGITPLIAISQVDEEKLLRDLHATQPHPTPAQQVQILATAKARDVAAQQTFTTQTMTTAEKPRVIIGCDSMFAFAGEVVGKPHTSQIARTRLAQMRNNYGDLYTGHCVIDTQTGQAAQGVSQARVYIGDLSDAEIEAYLASTEPLKVAGSFTIDGLGGSFIEKISGDPHGVVGISLPLVRQLLRELHLELIDFWDIRHS